MLQLRCLLACLLGEFGSGWKQIAPCALDDGMGRSDGWKLACEGRRRHSCHRQAAAPFSCGCSCRAAPSYLGCRAVGQGTVEYLCMKGIASHQATVELAYRTRVSQSLCCSATSIQRARRAIEQRTFNSTQGHKMSMFFPPVMAISARWSPPRLLQHLAWIIATQSHKNQGRIPPSPIHARWRCDTTQAPRALPRLAGKTDKLLAGSRDRVDMIRQSFDWATSTTALCPAASPSSIKCSVTTGHYASPSLSRSSARRITALATLMRDSGVQVPKWPSPPPPSTPFSPP